MRTVVISDLHLGTASGADLLQRSRPRERLLAALEGADRVVLLGDVVELRDLPARIALDRAAPVLSAIARAAAGARIVLVPGNHDHQLARPVLEPSRRAANGALGPARLASAGGAGLAGAVARSLGRDVAIAYPGYWIRPNVYATHGHYLDCHTTVARVEAVAAHVLSRAIGGIPHGHLASERYERALRPIYAFNYRRAQAPRAWRSLAGQGVAQEAAARRSAGPPTRRPSSRAARPSSGAAAAVAAANRIGIGPLELDLSPSERRDRGRAAMAEVIERLGVGGAGVHVIFGHTHRAGPFEGEEDGWTLPGGGVLVNCGSWVGRPEAAGTCVTVCDEGRPRLERLLATG